jgi:hypothetical protein
MRHLSFLLALVLASGVFAATVDPPARVTKLVKLDRTELAGVITSYDEAGFELMDNRKQTQKVAWEELTPDQVMNLNDRIVRRGSSDYWMALGRKLLTMPGGRPSATKAFGKAERLDPSLKEQIAAAKREANVPPPRVATPASRPATTGDATPSLPGDPNIDMRDRLKRVVGPKQVGEVDRAAWGKQTPEEMAASVAELKQFAERARATVLDRLVPYETQFFLFYSDLSDAQAQKWVAQLDEMYSRLARLFGVPAGENLWRGKALVFVFSREEDYQLFQIKMHQSVAAGTAGMCHTYGNGYVHIGFYRQPNDADFNHVLVHEAVHGFLHRYRSPVDIPSWANEGLADAIAFDMVKRLGIAQQTKTEAVQDLKQRGDLGDFFEMEHIVAWQYPVARTLCEFMITQNKKGYVDFINGIKDGLAWDESLKTHYGVTPEQLVSAYGISLNVRDLKPSR